MHCEFCDTGFVDLADARRHILTVAHVRAKRGYELSRVKFVERMRQAAIHPKDLYELLKVLNIHSVKDVEALSEKNFFKITKNNESAMVRNLINILHQSIVNYHMSTLPNDARDALIGELEKQRISNSNEE